MLYKICLRVLCFPYEYIDLARTKTEALVNSHEVKAVAPAKRVYNFVVRGSRVDYSAL